MPSILEIIAEANRLRRNENRRQIVIFINIFNLFTYIKLINLSIYLLYI
jgi:hypothetical protein